MSDCGGDCGGDDADDYSCTDHDYSHHEISTDSHAHYEHSSHEHEHHSSHIVRHSQREHSSGSALPSYEDAVGIAPSAAALHNQQQRHYSPSSSTDHSAADCRKADNRDKSNHDCRYHRPPHSHPSDHSSHEFYDQQQQQQQQQQLHIFDTTQAWNADRRCEAAETARRGRALGASKARQQLRAAGPTEQTYISKCNICLIAAFMVIAVSLLLILVFLKF